jgi:carbon-monoxide dehydrogenase medium subunit
MREFDYHAASSVQEALHLLDQYGEDGHIMAGGTSLMLMMEQGLMRPGHVVGLQNAADLKGVRSLQDGGLEIGAMNTHRQVERSADVKRYCATLSENLSRVATVRVRNQATIGGNLVHADPAQDPPPMLLALDADVVIASKSGQRTVPLDGFFEDYFQTAVQEGEVLTSIRLPAIPDGTRATYIKFLPRTEDDYATVSVAAVMRLGADKRCNHIRLALGASGPTPLRAKRVEAALQGQVLTDALIDQVSDLVREEVDPIGDIRGSANYKREMARVWTGRALRSLRDRE